MTQSILYVDYDGVLHPFSVYAQGETFELHWHDKSVKLFCWAPIIEAIMDDIDPHGRIKIVLSTTWAQRMHWTSAKSYLPESLQQRVISSTTWAHVARGVQIALHAIDYRIADDCWVAIDDDSYKWPIEHLDKLVLTDPELGLSCKKTQLELRKKLEKLLL